MFFDNIWVALVDPKLQIRECAAKTLSSCLALVANRVSFNRTQWYTYVTAPNCGGGGGAQPWCGMVCSGLGGAVMLRALLAVLPVAETFTARHGRT